MEEILGFPVFPRIIDDSTNMFIQTHCSPQKQSPQLAQLDASFQFIHSLCYVGVYFAVLWSSRQIFSFNESFYALLDDYRTRKESCSQLLCDLPRHKQQKTVYFHPVIMLSLKAAASFCLLHFNKTQTGIGGFPE